eukprot:168154-Rhodomonas_salina.1
MSGTDGQYAATRYLAMALKECHHITFLDLSYNEIGPLGQLAYALRSCPRYWPPYRPTHSLRAVRLLHLALEHNRLGAQ